MKKAQTYIILGFFGVICAGAIWKYSERGAQYNLLKRSLSDAALSVFDAELKTLTRKQVALQQAEIDSQLLRIAKTDAKLKDEIASIPFWSSTHRRAVVGFMLTVGGCLFVATGGASLAFLRKRSIVEQQLSEHTVLRVHYRTVKRADFALFTAKMAEIERVRATGNTEAALKLSMELLKVNTGLVKSLGRASHSSLLALSDGEKSGDVVHVPTFSELRARGEIAPDKPLLFGIDTDGQPVRGSWQDLYSSAIAGQSGNGKSSTARSLILQSLLTNSVEHFYILDPHRAKPEGLVNTLGNVVKLPCITYNEQTFDIPDVLQQFTQRMNARITGKEAPDKPLVLVIDELLTVIKNVPTVADVVKSLGTEGRGFKCYGLFLAQSWVGEDVGGTAVRDNLTSLIMHKMKRRQAQTMIQDADKARQIASLACGEVLFESTSDEARRLRIPFCSKADAAMMYHELSAQKVVNGYSESIATVAPVASGSTIISGTDKVTPVTPDVTKALPGVTNVKDVDILAQQIQEYLRGNSISLTKFAEAAGLNKGLLSAFLSGDKKLSEKMQEQVTAYLQAGNAQETPTNIIPFVRRENA